MGSQRSIATDLPETVFTTKQLYLTPKTSMDTCKVCGAANLVEQDQHSCSVCNKVLCVSCAEMQEKLLFMGNDTKKSRGDNCPLCKLLFSMSVEENTTPIDDEGIISYENHSEVNSPVLIQEVVDSKSTDGLTDAVYANNMSKVTGAKLLDSKRLDKTAVDSLETESQEKGIRGQNGETFDSGQGQKLRTSHNNGHMDSHATTMDMSHSVKIQTIADRGHDNKKETMTSSEDDKLSTTGQGDTLITTGQGDKLSSKGQGDKLSTTDQGDKLSTTDQGDKLSTADQGDKLSTADQGDKLSTADQGDKLSTADQGDKLSTADQGDKLSTADQGDSLATVNRSEKLIVPRNSQQQPNIGKQAKISTLTETSTQGNLEYVNLNLTDKTTDVNPEETVSTLDNGVSERKEILGRSVTYQKENKLLEDSCVHNVDEETEILKKREMTSSSDKSEKTDLKKNQTNIATSRSSTALSNLSSAEGSSNQTLMNFVDENDIDDDLEEVEYDNLGLKEYNEQKHLLDSVLGGLMGLKQLQKTQSAHRSGMRMAVVRIAEPGQVTQQQEGHGTTRFTQQIRYRDILIVGEGDTAFGSEENSSGDSTVRSSDTKPHDVKESIPHSLSNREPDDSNMAILDNFSAGIPNDFSSGDFSGLGSYEHFTNPSREKNPGISHPESNPVRRYGSNFNGQTGRTNTFQNSGSQNFNVDESVIPVHEDRAFNSAELSDAGGKTGRGTKSSGVSQKRSGKQNRKDFAHACSGCGRRDCEGSFMKFLREMILTAGNEGFEIRNVIPDGNCMFAAIVDQLELKKDFSFSPRSLRFECLNYLRENPKSEDGTPYALFLDGETWDEYLTRMSQDGEWGDHMVLQAISQVTKRNIQVIHHDTERDWTVIEHKQTPADKTDKSDCLFLGHVGEFHYVSLRPSDLAKQLHNDDDIESDDENFRSLDVFQTSPNLPNFDDPSKREMFEENYFDPWSEIPVVHLSYVMKKFVPNATTLQSADSMVANAEMMMEEGQLNTIRKHYGIDVSSSMVLIGDAAEGLYAPYLNERERTEYDKGSEWVDVTGLVMPNTCIAYPSDHSDVGEMDALIETKDVHPGYARLLTRYPSQWGMSSSGAGAVTCYLPSHHSNFKKAFNMSKEEKDYSASQNPSLVSFFNKISMAIVAPFWPAVAEEWKTRHRKANWPPQKIIDNIVSGGYHFECFPHPKSKNPDIEFHACFGVAEKLLAQEALSQDQRYIFLVFKALCSQEFTEDDLITSVHLKSIFFYACEQLPCDIWMTRPGSCVFYLLDALFTCIQERNVPDYFLSTNNLIDHFDEDQHKQILQKIMTLRNDPLSNLLKIGQKNRIYNAERILTLVTNDINVFHEHHSARRSVLEALVPISIDIAKYNIHTYSYKQALELLQEAYEERLAISTCEDALPFTAFLTQATDGCPVENQWWFYLNVDQQLHTTLCADLSMNMQPVALEELVGKDVAQTLVGTLIPAVMAHKLCRFCSDMAAHLYNTYHTQKCLPFLLYNLDRYREKRQRFALGNTQGQRQYFPNNRQPFTDEDEDDYTDSNALRVFNQLFIVYNRLNQLWIFQDLIPEFENLCEIINTRHAYTKLVNSLTQMGLTERAQMAEAKRNSIPSESTRSPYLDSSSTYY
ncbi:uncharacterized protein LOC132557086 [Ylistrum balloti]|uniref:uncharacterized protein LOC132557086 n=1 Tax=Ylistrum balloti TaxID=509963 RepID=UPI00290588C1|nr:uncharacterized protein LOC132557086 [Ylistrum balloti]